MSYHAWFEHFKEQLQGLTESFEQSGSPLSLLGYALREKKLSSEEYLKWAVAHYKLPKLRTQFFKETPLSQEMFAKWATHYPWSTECLPVAEWDGSLIVVCLQPPQDFPSVPASIIVLATFEDLEEAWRVFHPEKAKLPSNSPLEAAPEGIDLSMATVVQPHAKEGFSFEDLGVAEDANSSASLEVVEGEEPAASDEEGGMEGLFDGPTVVHLEALTPKTEAPAPAATASTPKAVSEEKTVVHKESSMDDALSEFSIRLEKKDELTLREESSAKTVVTPIPKENNPAKKESVAVVKTPPVKQATAVEASGERPAALATDKKIPPPPPKTDLPPPFEDSFGNKPIPITPRPAGVAKPTINPVASGNFALEKIKKKNTALINEKVKSILSEMKAHFEKSMIVTLDDQETQLIAFAWDENFQGMKDTSMRFPLKTPSIFNIVVATQKPFHGYISLNEINEKFFEDWNEGRIPDHVTVAPIIVDEKLVGMLVGFAEKSAYNKVSLNLAEKLSTEFVKGLQAA